MRAGFRLQDPQGVPWRVLITKTESVPYYRSRRERTVVLPASFDVQELLDKGWSFLPLLGPVPDLPAPKVGLKEREEQLRDRERLYNDLNARFWRVQDEKEAKDKTILGLRRVAGAAWAVAKRGTDFDGTKLLDHAQVDLEPFTILKALVKHPDFPKLMGWDEAVCGSISGITTTPEGR